MILLASSWILWEFSFQEMYCVPHTCLFCIWFLEHEAFWTQCQEVQCHCCLTITENQLLLNRQWLKKGVLHSSSSNTGQCKVQFWVLLLIGVLIINSNDGWKELTAIFTSELSIIFFFFFFKEQIGLAMEDSYWFLVSLISLFFVSGQSKGMGGAVAVRRSLSE